MTKTYEVTITEVLQRNVPVRAESQHEAEVLVENAYYEQQYVLHADDLKETTFSAREQERSQAMERWVRKMSNEGKEITLETRPASDAKSRLEKYHSAFLKQMQMKKQVKKGNGR